MGLQDRVWDLCCRLSVHVGKGGTEVLMTSCPTSSRYSFVIMRLQFQHLTLSRSLGSGVRHGGVGNALLAFRLWDSLLEVSNAELYALQ